MPPRAYSDEHEELVFASTSSVVPARRTVRRRTRTAATNLEECTKPTRRRCRDKRPSRYINPPVSALLPSSNNRHFNLQPPTFLSFIIPFSLHPIPIPLLYPLISWYPLHNLHGSRKPWVSPSFSPPTTLLMTTNSGGDPGALDPQGKPPSLLVLSLPMLTAATVTLGSMRRHPGH